jgi:hypothetical protein
MERFLNGNDPILTKVLIKMKSLWVLWTKPNNFIYIQKSNIANECLQTKL